MHYILLTFVAWGCVWGDDWWMTSCVTPGEEYDLNFTMWSSVSGVTLCRLEGPNFWFQHVLQIKQAGGFIEDFNTVVSYGSQVIGEFYVSMPRLFCSSLRSRSLIKELFLCFAKTLWNIRRYSNVLASSGCALDEERPFCCTDDPSLFHFSRLNLCRWLNRLLNCQTE